MKKIFVLLTILFALAAAEQVVANCAACIYDAPGGKIIEGVSTVKGKVYEVLDKKVSYHYIEVLDSDWSKQRKGWVWAVKVKDGLIIDKGVTFRQEPFKSADTIGVLKPGRKVKILNSKITWYKIKEGWVFNTRINS